MPKPKQTQRAPLREILWSFLRSLKAACCRTDFPQLLLAGVEMIDSLLNYRTAQRVVTGQCGKKCGGPLCVCVRLCCFSLFLWTVMYFRISCRSLQFSKYFNITNGNSRRRRRGKKKVKGREREKEAKRQGQGGRNEETVGKKMRAIAECAGETAGHATAKEHLSVSALRSKNTCFA